MQAVLDALPDPAFILSKSGKYVALFGGKDSRYYHDGSALVGRLLSEVLNASKTQYFIRVLPNSLLKQKKKTFFNAPPPRTPRK